MDAATATWLVTAITGVLAAMAPVGLRLIATRAGREHDQEIAEQSLQLQLRNELRTTLKDLRSERTVLRDEIKNLRSEIDDLRRRYDGCEEARLELMAKVERLERDQSDLQGRTTRLEDRERRNGGDNLGMAGS